MNINYMPLKFHLYNTLESISCQKAYFTSSNTDSCLSLISVDKLARYPFCCRFSKDFKIGFSFLVKFICS